MTFDQLKTELFARGADYLSEDAAGVARAARWINQAYRQILNLQAWRFLQATATGSAGAGLVVVADLRQIRYVRDTSSGKHLSRASLDDLVAEDLDPAATGAPDYYYVDTGNTVKGFPLGGTLEVNYLKRVDPMSNAADEPIFDEEYHDLIVDRAMMKVYKDSDNFEAAAALKQEFDAGVRAMAEDYLIESREVQFIPVNSFDG